MRMEIFEKKNLIEQYIYSMVLEINQKHGGLITEKN